jgi:RES domain-containing protein
MLPRDALVVAVQELPVQPRQGLAFRLILARYAATALSSIGSLRAGGRYNMRGEFEALYLTSSPVTARSEVEALVATAEGLRGVKGPPRILLSIDYELEAVVDLTEPTAQQLLGSSLAELSAPWRTLNAAGQLRRRSCSEVSFTSCLSLRLSVCHQRAIPRRTMWSSFQTASIPRARCASSMIRV